MKPIRSCSALAIVAALGVPFSLGEAGAESPVCAPPSPQAEYRIACLPGGRFWIGRLLAEFTLDHQFRVSTQPISRDLEKLAPPTNDEEVAASLDAWFDSRWGDVTFAPLDRSSGTFVGQQQEDAPVDAWETPIGSDGGSLRLSAPARIEGAYWRTPGVVELAFWKDAQPRLHWSSTSSPAALDDEIACLSVSLDSVRIETADAGTPDLLVLFADCPP